MFVTANRFYLTVVIIRICLCVINFSVRVVLVYAFQLFLVPVPEFNEIFLAIEVFFVYPVNLFLGS